VAKLTGPSELTKLAAECHRAKWQFDVNSDQKLPAAEARRLVAKAFDELHRIGDLALKHRAALQEAGR
jgi:hypothetical protein